MMRRSPRAHHRSLTRRTLGVVAILALTVMGMQLSVSSASADTSPTPGTPSTVSADLLPSWQTNGVIWSSVTVGNTVYFTGSFTKARPSGVPEGGAGEIDAGNIFAMDIRTGERVASFSHTLNAQGTAITASPDGTRVYVGGSFTTVDGVARNRLAAFDTATGNLVTSFYPRPYAQVTAIAATNTAVYYGGTFTSVGGTARMRLAAADAATGALLSWAPTADNGQVKSMVLAPDNSRVIIGGQFTTLNGSAAYGMGSVSTSTGAQLPWAANSTIRSAGNNGAVDTLHTDGTLIYGGAFAFGKGATFEGTFAADPYTGAIQWLNDCHGDTYDTLPVGQVLYVASHDHDCSAIRSFPDTTNPRIAHRALAFTTYATTTNKGPDSYGWNYNGKPAGQLLHWFPTLDAGTFTGQGQAAWTVTGNSTYVVWAGEFPKVNNVAQAGIVRFAVPPTAPNKVLPFWLSTLTPQASEFFGTVTVKWKATWDMDNENLTYRVKRDGTTIWTSPVTASNFWTMPSMQYQDTTAPKGSHTYQVLAVDPVGNIRWSSVSNTVTVN
jgi:hypothetical protein